MEGLPGVVGCAVDMIQVEGGAKRPGLFLRSNGVRQHPQGRNSIMGATVHCGSDGPIFVTRAGEILDAAG